MAHSREIIVKCPACSEKFEAEREEEATFVSCPGCEMQVKISGLEDRGSRRSLKLPRISALPARRPDDGVLISDLSQTEAEIDRLRTSRRHVPSSERATPSSSPDPRKESRPALSGRERRLARELAKVNELKRQIARQSRRKDEPREVLLDELAEVEDALMHIDEPAAVERPGQSVEADPATTEGTATESRPKDAEEQVSAYEKVQVDSTGERRRLREAPLAELPEPKPRRASIHGETIDLARRRDEIVSVPSPVQPFESRQITRGSIWRRRKPDRSETPGWEETQAEGERRRRRRKRSKLRRLLVGTAALACVALAWHGSKVWKQSHAMAKTETVVVPEKEGSPSVIDLFEKARPVVEGFLAAESIEAAQPFLRNGEEIGYLMKKHYLESGFKPVEVVEIGPGLHCELFEGILVVPVVLKNFDERGLAYDIASGKIDWESWAGYSEMGFNELCLRRPEEPVLLRCYLTQDAYFNYGFSDPDRYLSFKLVDASRENHLWGYVDKTSPVFREVATGLVETRGSGPTNMATLRVAYPPGMAQGNASDQVLITEFLTLGWVVRDSPPDDDESTTELTGRDS